jgi:serine/threonine protein kinase
MALSRLEQVLLDVCDGLLFCHGGCGGTFEGLALYHRDVKPANILLRGHQEGCIQAALGDFGVSKLLPTSTKYYTTRNTTGTDGYGAV